MKKSEILVKIAIIFPKTYNFCEKIFAGYTSIGTGGYTPCYRGGWGTLGARRGCMAGQREHLHTERISFVGLSSIGVELGVYP
jgi:hypothetical protein